MKKKLFAFFIVFGVTFIASNLLAADYQWTGERYIAKIYPQNGRFVIVLDGDKIIPESSCNNRFLIEATNSNFDFYVASLLTAFAMERPVNIYFDFENLLDGCSAYINRFNFSY